MKRIYLDNNATTILDPLVLETMQANLCSIPSNPSSNHYFGKEAKKKLIKARHTISEFFSVKTSQLIFTSGGTEAINMILKGLFPLFHDGHIITSDIEHAAVRETVKFLEERGVSVTYLKVGSYGAPTPKQVEEAIEPDTKMIALSAANSEIGVKTDIEAIAKIAVAHDLFYFVDGVGLLGKEAFTIPEGVSAMAFSGHKLHGPMGSGLAFIRAPQLLTPLLHGGGQEYGHRSGTENLLSILGLAKAIELLNTHLPDATTQMQTLRDHFEIELKKIKPDILINGEGPRIPNTSNIAFTDQSGEELLINLDMQGIIASHGSACSSGAFEPSRVLLNMGLSKKRASSSLRFSLSRYTTREEIDETLKVLRSLLR